MVSQHILHVLCPVLSQGVVDSIVLRLLGAAETTPELATVTNLKVRGRKTANEADFKWVVFHSCPFVVSINITHTTDIRKLFGTLLKTFLDPIEAAPQGCRSQIDTPREIRLVGSAPAFIYLLN